MALGTILAAGIMASTGVSGAAQINPQSNKITLGSVPIYKCLTAQKSQTVSQWMESALHIAADFLNSYLTGIGITGDTAFWQYDIVRVYSFTTGELTYKPNHMLTWADEYIITYIGATFLNPRFKTTTSIFGEDSWTLVAHF